MSIVQRMDHFTIVTDRLDETRSFYEALGLAVGDRPDFPVPGFWFYAGERPILHVIGVEKMPEPRRGVLDHMAFFGVGLADTMKMLAAKGVETRLIRPPRPYRTWQLFFLDPNGCEVEIDFDESEPEPEGWRKAAAKA
jgi:catechol 2,3-dioxygenase-like lactoylglutathione lyase family enzyme